MTPLPPSPPDPIDPELLGRYFAGECTPLEAASLTVRLSANPGWRRAADMMATLRFSDADRSTISTEDTLARLQTRLAEPRATGVSPAASRGNNSTFERPVVTASSSWWSRPTFQRFAVASAAIALAMTLSLDPVQRLWRQAPESPVREYAVRAGERATITLVDGTRVTLGPESRLRYPDSFNNTVRTVELDGVGYFEVTHDPRRPFTVYAGSAVVQELGTSFGVTAYGPDSTVHVVVAEGRVALRSRSAPPRSGTTLARGDAGVIDREGLAAITRNIDVDQALSWTQGRLVFDDITLREAADILSRWYDIEIAFATPKLAKRRVTAEFGTESLNEVLSQLAEILKVRYVRSDRHVTVME